MSNFEHEQRSNVIKFAPRIGARAAAPAASAATIMAEAFIRKLGDTDMTSDAVQHAVNGVLSELERLWRADTEQQVRAQLQAENDALRAEIARRIGG